MDLRSISFLFEVMIYVGIGLPLVNVLLGALTSSSGDTDLDLDVDTDIDLDLDLDLDVDIDVDIDFDPDVGDLSADATDLAGRPGWKSPIQFNLYCLCLFMVIMGSIGTYGIRRAESVIGLIATLVFGFVLAATAYCLLYYFVVRRLKENDASALKMNSLLHQHAKVTFRILKDSPGQIQTRDRVGAVISYRAELDGDVCHLDRIDEGEEVIITEIDKGSQLCYVTVAERKILD